MMRAFFTWWGTGSVPFASSCRSDGLPCLLSWNRTCTSWFTRTIPSCLPDRTFRTSGAVVRKLRKPLCPTFLATFRASFCVCCSRGGVAITTVGDCLSLCSARLDRQDRAYPRIRWTWSPSRQSLCQVRTALTSRLSCPLGAVSTLTVPLFSRLPCPVTAAFIAVLDDCWPISIICAVSSSSWRLSISTCWTDVITTQYPNTKISCSVTMQEWETTQHVFKCAGHNGWCELFSSDPTWAQDVWVWEECHCRVYCNRLWCDQLCSNITRVQQAGNEYK